ncbi:membrane protein [Actinoplanes sp. NBRC 14428]|nr:membrane protein [Actinoplanes sp. NBRC 14428]
MSFVERLKQIGQVFAFTARQDRWFVPLIIAAVLIPLALTVLLVLLGYGWIWIPIGIMVALLASLIVLNLRSNAAMMNAAEGQPGAAASIMENMRGDWRVRPAASSTTQFDMVHVVIGRPGVILLGEGQPQRVRSLMGQEKRRLSKVIGNAPMYDYIIGQQEGELSIRKLRTTVMKLPRNLTGKDVNALDKRLAALMARPRCPRAPSRRTCAPRRAPSASNAPADPARACMARRQGYGFP